MSKNPIDPATLPPEALERLKRFVAFTEQYLYPLREFVQEEAEKAGLTPWDAAQMLMNMALSTSMEGENSANVMPRLRAMCHELVDQFYDHAAEVHAKETTEGMTKQ